MSKLDKFIDKGLIQHQKEIEKVIGAQYAQIYKQALKEFAILFTFDNTDIAEIRKYNRLDNVIKEIEKAYKKLTGKVLTEIEANSAYQYVEKFMGSMWTAEVATNPFKWKNPQVEAIRKAVFNSDSGLNVGKRITNNAQASIIKVEEAIVRGISSGIGYRKISEDIGQVFKSGYNDALRVVRTESTRLRSEGYNSAYDTMVEAGLPVKKVWISADDERTRTGKYDHRILDGLESDLEGMFYVGQGIGKVSAPSMSGVAGFDINCRCTVGTQFDDEPRMSQQEMQDGYEEWKKSISYTQAQNAV